MATTTQPEPPITPPAPATTPAKTPTAPEATPAPDATTATLARIEQRLAAIEATLGEIRAQLPPPPGKLGWLEQVSGIMKDFPEFEEVVAYGRAFREADHPVFDEA